MQRTAARLVVLLAAAYLTPFCGAQTIVNRTQVVLPPYHTHYAQTDNPGMPDIHNVKSSNASVATATVYRVSQVQIVAVAPGRTDIEYFDAKSGITYRVPVWVQPSNSTGGGAGYDPRKAQLSQVVMLVKHTQNIKVPGGGTPQISGVVSSNPSVATARTNTVDTIQIYAVALGDTFIDFTDNSTGTTYQVHVWVKDQLSGLDGTGGGDLKDLGKGPHPNPKPNAKPNPMPGPRPGQMDKCLVGQWVSSSAAFSRHTTGGVGSVITVSQNGSVAADYTGMSKIVFDDGGSYSWTGTASGHISAENGLLAADGVGHSTFNFDILDPKGQSMLSHQGWWRNTLGGILPPPTAVAGISYQCSDSTLRILQTAPTGAQTTFVLQRRKR